MLEIKNISKSFNKTKVLDDISFNLNEGEIITIAGKSGAGKTTLLRCIAYLEKCDSGSIKIFDKYLCEDKNNKSVYSSKKEISEIAKNVAFVFQSFNLFPHLNVLENITYAPIYSRNIDKDDSVKNAIDILESLQIEDKINSYPFELSGGQKQRVAIARALALNPKIICFDEPTSALDPQLTNEISKIIKNLASKGMGIITITHDVGFAKNLGGQVINLDKGKIKLASII